MTNKLTEQQLKAQLLAEFDAINKLGRGIGRTVGAGAKALGSVAGGVAGLGSAIKQGYNAGKQTVGGGGANVQTKQQPKQQQNQQQQKQPSKTGGVLKNLAKNVGNVALDTAAGSGYNYRQGVNPNPTGVGAGLKKADAEAQRKAGLEKKLGTTGTQATATNTAKTAVDKSIARNQKKVAKQSGIKQGINQATTQKGATAVPGQKAPVAQVDKNKDGKDDKSGKPMAPASTGKGPAQVDANKDGKDDKTGKPMSKTATDVKNKAGVKAGGVQLDPSNPEHKALISAIEKASPGLTKTVNKLDAGSKGKLLKGLQAA